MNTADLAAILPLIAIAATAIAVMIAVAIRRNRTASLAITLAGLAAAFGCLRVAARVAPRQVTPLLMIDSYALFYTGLILAAAFAVALFGYHYFARQRVRGEELYILLATATLGAAVLVSAAHFASFFLGLELLSVPLYAMIAYTPGRRKPAEAGLKYLILAAASAAFLLFGMALVYAASGSLEFSRMAAGAGGLLPLAGTALIVTGIGFKLAVVPFHLWTPDVYEGAPAPVTAFVATVSKGAMVGLTLRFFHAPPEGPLWTVFAIIAAASMIAGNLLALAQNNVKRILAYSSIAHLGYILVAFLAGSELGSTAVTFYLVAYFVTTLGCFGVVTVLSGADGDADDLASYRGLFYRAPWLAGIFSAMLFSLAGIPLTAGFLGKFYVVAAGAASAIWALIILLVVTSAIGLYYYLRIILALYSKEDALVRAPRVAALPAGLLWVLAVLLIWLGTYPAPMMSWIRGLVRQGS